MSILIMLITVSILVAMLFFGLFVWAVKSGQYEDTESPAVRVLIDGKRTKAERPQSTIDSKKLNSQQSTKNS